MLVRPKLIISGTSLTQLRWVSKPNLGSRRLAAMPDSDLVGIVKAAVATLQPRKAITCRPLNCKAPSQRMCASKISVCRCYSSRRRTQDLPPSTGELCSSTSEAVCSTQGPLSTVLTGSCFDQAKGSQLLEHPHGMIAPSAPPAMLCSCLESANRRGVLDVQLRAGDSSAQAIPCLGSGGGYCGHHHQRQRRQGDICCVPESAQVPHMTLACDLVQCCVSHACLPDSALCPCCTARAALGACIGSFTCLQGH